MEVRGSAGQLPEVHAPSGTLPSSPLHTPPTHNFGKVSKTRELPDAAAEFPVRMPPKKRSAAAPRNAAAKRKRVAASGDSVPRSRSGAKPTAPARRSPAATRPSGRPSRHATAAATPAVTAPVPAADAGIIESAPPDSNTAADRDSEAEDSSDENDDPSNVSVRYLLSEPATLTPRLTPALTPSSSGSFGPAFGLAVKSIREFSPEINVRDWVYHFRTETAALDEQTQLALFRNKVYTACFTWFMAASRENPHRTIQGWLTALESTFRTTPLQLRNAIRARRQHDGEDAGSYIRDIVALCVRFNPVMSTVEKISYITDGVHPKYIHQFVQFNVHADSISMTENSLRAAMEGHANLKRIHYAATGTGFMPPFASGFGMAGPGAYAGLQAPIGFPPYSFAPPQSSFPMTTADLSADPCASESIGTLSGLSLPCTPFR